MISFLPTRLVLQVLLPTSALFPFLDTVHAFHYLPCLFLNACNLRIALCCLNHPTIPTDLLPCLSTTMGSTTFSRSPLYYSHAVPWFCCGRTPSGLDSPPAACCARSPAAPYYALFAAPAADCLPRLDLDAGLRAHCVWHTLYRHWFYAAPLPFFFLPLPSFRAVPCRYSARTFSRACYHHAAVCLRTFCIRTLPLPEAYALLFRLDFCLRCCLTCSYHAPPMNNCLLLPFLDANPTFPTRFVDFSRPLPLFSNIYLRLDRQISLSSAVFSEWFSPAAYAAAALPSPVKHAGAWFFNDSLLPNKLRKMDLHIRLRVPTTERLPACTRSMLDLRATRCTHRAISCHWIPDARVRARICLGRGRALYLPALLRLRIAAVRAYVVVLPRTYPP